MLPVDDPTTLSLLFHLNSEPWLNDEAYQGGSPAPRADEFPEPLATVKLPDSVPGDVDRLAARRQSCRHYEDCYLPLASVAALLSSGYGIVDHVEGSDGARLLRHAVPSAGGLFPLELLVFLRRIDTIPDGVYRYDAIAHELDLVIADDQFETVLAPSLYAYPFIEDANGFVAMTAVFERTQHKYGPRGYRYILLEAGHVAQNLALRAAELELATLCAGGFSDSRLNAALGMDPRRAGVVYGVGFGKARAEQDPISDG
jgi:SagB-type dehydrogenase family enzyme